MEHGGVGKTGKLKGGAKEYNGGYREPDERHNVPLSASKDLLRS